MYLGGGSGSLVESNSGYANYNGLIATIQHRFSSSFSLLANYTWSKCLDIVDPQGDISGTQLSQPNNPRADYGRCGSDQRNIFNSFIVAKSNFPIHGIGGYLINNWELAPTVSILSGFPVNLSNNSSDLSLTQVGSDRPNQIPGVNPYRKVTIRRVSSAATSSYLNPAAFAQITAACPSGATAATCGPNAFGPNTGFGDFGNVGRNSLNGPMQFNMNAQLSRIFPIRKLSLDARIEAFNVLNHPNFNGPNGSVGNGSFGYITGQQNGARVFQGAVKVSF
jgi:hypothetical protein